MRIGERTQQADFLHVLEHHIKAFTVKTFTDFSHPPMEKTRLHYHLNGNFILL